MPRIAIIVGSTRPGRNATAVSEWVLHHASQRSDATFDVLDLAHFDLPVLDEPVPASMGQYQHSHTKRWAAAVDSYDGFVFLTPEYNHSTSGALKNAIDFIYGEWNNKAAGFVSWGSAGGVRAVEALRLIAGELQIADVRAQVSFFLATDFVNYSEFTPAGRHVADLDAMLDQLVAWSTALAGVRSAQELEAQAA